MTHKEIFHQAAAAADDATAAKFGCGDGQYPSSGTGAGDYWKLVYEATVAALLKWNGSY